jgi:pimeloyl-ACP methyl ester carboxylesterase
MTSFTLRLWWAGILAAAMLLAAPELGAAQSISLEPGTVHLTPAFVTLDDGRTVAYEEGLLFVPENRRAASRSIAVRFRRFPAQAGADGPPVFYLPGGPGSTLDQGELASNEGQEIIDFFTSVGDLVIVDQRGNANVDVPFIPTMEMQVSGVPLDVPGDPEALKQAYRAGFTSALETWRNRGVDLAGYDILNAVDDVDDLRAALGYEQIILRGNSFGSQWSLAYLKRHPDRVARALIGGVEPLNHAYDRPADVWAAHQRIIRLAEADPDVQAYLPEEGFEPAIRALLDRLETNPERVTLPHPKTGEMTTVALGRYDLQQALKRFAPDYYTRDGLATWPRFVLELMNGDFRYLAALTYRSRQADRMPLIFPLIDNSLGITAERDEALRADPATAMVGPINSFYYSTRDLSPTPDVGDDFRTGLTDEVPVLMIQGDLDRSTPVENAQHLHEMLPGSHLLYVENGTHMAIREVRQFHPNITEQVRAFLQTGALGALPARVTLPPPDFETPGETSLFQQFAADARIPE